jgi:hypothetical protein
MTDRQTLPQRRHNETFELTFWKQRWLVSVGYYADNRTIGELFINAAKSPGTELEAMCRDAAIVFSLAIQHGTPVETIRTALTRDPNGAASSIVGEILDRLATKRVL